MWSAFRGGHHHLTSEVRSNSETLVCMRQAGDAGPEWGSVADDLDIRSAPRLEQALHHADTRWRLVSSMFAS